MWKGKMKYCITPQYFQGIISGVEEAICCFYEYLPKFGQNSRVNLQSDTYSELIKVQKYNFQKAVELHFQSVGTELESLRVPELDIANWSQKWVMGTGFTASQDKSYLDERQNSPFLFFQTPYYRHQLSDFHLSLLWTHEELWNTKDSEVEHHHHLILVTFWHRGVWTHSAPVRFVY